MRRSKAPSELAKFKHPIKTLSNVTALKDKTNGDEKQSLFSIAPKHSGCLEEQELRPPVLSQSDEIKVESLRIFNVVYGKISKKKHKTWEGDGTLEVSSSHLTLKDDCGKSLGQVRNSKNITVEEGSRIFVGNKEVEVIDAVISKVSVKRPFEKDENIVTNAAKKTKNIEESKSQLLKSLGGVLKTSKLHSRYDPLIMPTPSDEHQWEFNSDYLPVTEVSVEAKLCRVLRPHQREGITFLYRCISGIRNLEYTGAILADEMGLGKTLQSISLIWTLLNQGPYGGKPLLNKVLVIVPSSLVQNWNNEFIRWVGSHRLKVFSIDQRNRPEDYIKNSHIPVLIISYEMFVRSYEILKEINFDLIVCDEGHRLKNSNIKAAVLLNTLPCRRRILLTGTPVQNDLQEFYSLIDLVNPGVLGTLKEFQKNYVRAIMASKEPKASEEIVKEGKEKSEELNRLTSSFILRRTQAIIDKFLPVKNEYVVFCCPSVLQKEVYNAVAKLWYYQCVENSNSSEPYTGLHLQIIHALKKICNHPALLNNACQETVINGDFLDTLQCIISQHKFSEDLAKDSGKLNLLCNLLKFLSTRDERIVIVSCFTQTLDLLEEICKECKYKYGRFDGSTPLSARTTIVNKFNDKNSDIFVLLLSNKAGGLGLNLIGGSRLVLYDSDWNPAIDLQAMARIWREGQRKQVFIYRFLTSGTIEEKIFQRQLSKAGLNESIVDTASESNVKLSFEELKNLFSSISSDGCITHTSLNCDCIGDGSIPQSEVEDLTCREAELLVENSSAKCSLRMNQLFQWEHHAKPVSEHLLLEMGLKEVGDAVNFVFKNKSS